MSFRTKFVLQWLGLTIIAAVLVMGGRYGEKVFEKNFSIAFWFMGITVLGEVMVVFVTLLYGGIVLCVEWLSFRFRNDEFVCELCHRVCRDKELGPYSSELKGFTCPDCGGLVWFKPNDLGRKGEIK